MVNWDHNDLIKRFGQQLPNSHLDLQRLAIVELLPALVTADHVAVIVGEATDAAGDVSPVAAILGGAECGAPGCFVLAPWNKQPPLSLSDQHGGGRGGWWCRWGPSPIVMVLMGGWKIAGVMWGW